MDTRYLPHHCVYPCTENQPEKPTTTDDESAGGVIDALPATRFGDSLHKCPVRNCLNHHEHSSTLTYYLMECVLPGRRT